MNTDTTDNTKSVGLFARFLTKQAAAIPVRWRQDVEWLPHQRQAIEDYCFEKYLAVGRTPYSIELALPMELKHYMGSFCVTGAVGIGKTTALRAFCDSYPKAKLAPPTCPMQFVTLYRLEDFDLLKVDDFSTYIEQFLRDITPTAHIHAQVMYREIYRSLWRHSHSSPRPWMLCWDRFPLENILFAREAAPSGALFSEFWPTAVALNGLKKLVPSKVYMPYWPGGKGPNGEILIDDERRIRQVAQRDRCDAELVSKDDQAWFYHGALKLYKIIGSDIICCPFDELQQTIRNFVNMQYLFHTNSSESE